MNLDDFLKRDQNKVRDLFEQWDDNKAKPPLFMNLEDYLSFAERIKVTLDIIDETTNPRHIPIDRTHVHN